ncbi:MAG TPA: NB-ARC domain-containing protein, partial [Anaerolineae bacterium]|nr:NB-ARC domain-containing protein [Anaerolineae bacterium]
GDKMSKQTGKNSEFAALADQGIRAYQHAEQLRLIGMADQYIADAIDVGQSTVNGWRRGRTVRRYADLTRFAAVCLEAAPELGEQWVVDLFREADMARYCDKALAEIFESKRTTPKLTTSATVPAAGSRLNAMAAVPPLPEQYISRQNKLATLRKLTLARRERGGWVALLGMTGVGKSTLLAALGHDTAIQAAFAGNVRWIELRQTTTTHRLAQRIAQAFGQALPNGNVDNAEIIAALRDVLPAQPILLLLDNVVDPTVVAPLHALDPRVVIVVTARSVRDMAVLRIPEKACVPIGKLERDEAWALAEKIVMVPEAQRPTAEAVLALLEYHPYLTVVAASAAATLDLEWSQIHGIITDLALRAQAQRFLADENSNVWATLEMDWERLNERHQYALATLGCLPYFLHYDLPLAQAAWGLSASEAALVWKILTAMQLARPAPDFPGEYTVHWLIRDFAADKAQQWSLWQRLRFMIWPWRYRLPFRLRWWWPALRKPKPNVNWPWYSFTLPGTEGRRGMRFIWSWMSDTLWRQSEQQLNLRVGPVEWATVKRLATRFVGAYLAGVCLMAAVVLAVWQKGYVPYGAVGGLVGAVWTMLVAQIDLRRAAIWWGLETSLPYTAAFTDTDQDKDPVS